MKIDLSTECVSLFSMQPIRFHWKVERKQHNTNMRHIIIIICCTLHQLRALLSTDMAVVVVVDEFNFIWTKRCQRYVLTHLVIAWSETLWFRVFGFFYRYERIVYSTVRPHSSKPLSLSFYRAQRKYDLFVRDYVCRLPTSDTERFCLFVCLFVL